MRELLLGKSQVFLDWQMCQVDDYVNVTCCTKCQCYGHPERYCRSTKRYCGRCASTEHETKDCTADKAICATCTIFKKPDADTHATASRLCPARAYAESRQVAATRYSV